MTKQRYNLYIDISCLAHSNTALTGIQRVEYHIFNYFVRRDNARFIFFSFKKQKFFLVDRQLIVRLVEDLKRGGKIQPRIAGFRKILERSARQDFASRADDFVLIPFGILENRQYVKQLQDLSRRSKLLQILHDTIPHCCPEVHSPEFLAVLKDYLKRSLPYCHRIAANSRYTAVKLVEMLKSWGIADIPPVIVFPFGSDIGADQARRPRQVKHRDYFLMVITLNIRKNAELLVQVYRLARERGVDLPHLYVAGQRGNDLIRGLIHQIENDAYLKTKISLLGSKTNDELRWLYNNCQLFIFPSIYESYGLPLVEALSSGKVSLASKNGSLPEVGGEYADYFSPFSADELLELIVKYRDPATRLKREQLIKRKYRHLTWEQAMVKFETDLDELSGSETN